MTIYNLLSLFGVPTLTVALFTWLYKRIANKLKLEKNETDAIKAGIQALLRDRLYEMFSVCKQKGYATISERQNFDSLYNQYHKLGANGVMDDTRAKFLKLDVHDE